tara:strand:+ start:6426 stop:6641 length:216 start_codon:yes stop_codon:yes gene_type:complete
MDYKNYLKSVRQGYEDPTEYNGPSRYCEECDIEENKTYFVDNTSICQDCYVKLEDEDDNIIGSFDKYGNLI